ncbi:MAG TPA: hypothetical protein VNW71_00480 [Thermoanaerobaculia bacterium]|nr:hypothetical protein [Thermoanaerobaculia bacterium]
MSRRWLAGAFLFALGFGSAFLTKLPAADAAAKEVVVAGTLKYVDDKDFKLIYPPGGKTDYLVAVSRKPGTAAANPQVAYKTGEAVFAKKNLQSLTVYEVKPLIQWQSAPQGATGPPRGKATAPAAIVGPGRTIRCGHPQIYCPLPPVPGPPIMVSYVVVKPR